MLGLCDVGNRKTCHYGLGLTPGKKLPQLWPVTLSPLQSARAFGKNFGVPDIA